MKTASVFLIGLLCMASPCPAVANDVASLINAECGGHVKTRGQALWYDAETPQSEVRDNPFYDESTDMRLKLDMFAGEYLAFKIHYEAAVAGGHTRKSEGRLAGMVPEWPSYFQQSGEIDDDNRLLDLTHTIEKKHDYIAYHRLDRLLVDWQAPFGTIRAGRQAVSWGNGLLFHPMDLFNPFSPTAIDKEYKNGDDMLYCQIPGGKWGEWQILYVPRRDPADHRVGWETSSLAAKGHYFLDSLEIDVMAASHYEDKVVGLGSSGYLLDAAWRIDATYTLLNDSNRCNFVSLAANIDYSWVWWHSNFYGFIEFYHTGLGDHKPGESLTRPEITERLERGEIFVLAKSYLAGHLRMEVHPLVNLYLTSIQNLHDGSGVLQPRLSWDPAQNVNCTLGANIYYGRQGAEFGGIAIPDTDFSFKPADSIYLWVALYF